MFVAHLEVLCTGYMVHRWENAVRAHRAWMHVLFELDNLLKFLCPRFLIYEMGRIVPVS